MRKEKPINSQIDLDNPPSLDVGKTLLSHHLSRVLDELEEVSLLAQDLSKITNTKELDELMNCTVAFKGWTRDLKEWCER